MEKKVVIWALFCATTMPLAALVEGREDVGGNGWRYGLAVSSFHLDTADIDAGGQTGLRSYHLQARARRHIGAALSVGVGFNYSHHQRRFSGPAGFGSLRPWGDTTRIGASTLFLAHTGNTWSLGVRPFISTFSESGNLESDSLSFGTLLAGIARFGDDRRIAFGGRIARDLDGSLDLTPLITVDWRINDQWMLANPSEPDTVGNKGLELVYLPNPDWEMALGGVYHSARFLLDDKGIAPGGIGEHEALIAFARLARKLRSGLRLKGYIGAAFHGRLSVEDAGGETVAQSDYDTMPLAGVSLETRF